MPKFIFKSPLFSLTLEDDTNPIETFKAVVDSLPKDFSQRVVPEQSITLDKSNEAEKKPHFKDEYQDIDEFFATDKPNNIRKILEGTANYLTKIDGKIEFTKDELFDKAKTSLSYDVSWTKNRSTTLDRMVKDGFLARRPEGKLIVK